MRWMLGGMLGIVLLAAQWLSLAHRIDHAPGLAASVVAQELDGHGHGHQHEHQHEHEDGHKQGGASCQLLDHLGLADALPGLVFSLPAAPCADDAPAAVLRSVGHRPAPRAFHARAPPRA